MEVKKSSAADLEGRRVQGFLLGLIVVLAAVFVALEWNSSDSGWAFFDNDEDLEAEMELSPLKRDQDEIPMMLPQEKKEELPKSEELHLVDEDVELPPPLEQEVTEKPDPEAEAEEKPEVVDMYNEPVDFRVVEDLPQFPGGAAEFMKWLTKNLKYPVTAQKRKVKGRVVAQFIVNTDGSVSDLELTEKLETSCDNEVLRVLRMMPKWQAGMMNAKPCRTKVCIPIVFNM
ncbi:MAG: TonB family protein [Prevotella sp.]|nr:TonB family protein [Prevotella sp.]